MGDSESEIQNRQQAREEAEVYQTGGWYIAELDDPQLAVQSESEADARQKNRQTVGRVHRRTRGA